MATSRGAKNSTPQNEAVASANHQTPRVLYRKYRPTKLEDVVGQEQVTTLLSNAIKNQSLSHAYLFIGPRGTGKTSVARIFAHAINDFPYQVEDNYLDIVEIDAASNTGVDNIRDLREKAIIAPTNGKYKVYIIDEVHMLTKAASNALLKTLEEPPAHVVFIMATTDAHKVPITISSRTQVHTFKLADPQIMRSHLRKIADAEKIAITDDALEIVVRRGGGSFRDSLSLLDQIASISDHEITAPDLNLALGLPSTETIQQLLAAYAIRDNAEIGQLLKTLLNSGIKPEIASAELINQILQQPQPDFLPLLSKLTTVQAPFAEAKLLLALLSFESIASPQPSSATVSPSRPMKAPAPATTANTTPTPAMPTAQKPSSPAERKAQFINQEPENNSQPSPAEAPTAHQESEDAKNPTTEDPAVPQSSQPTSASSGDFSWENFLDTIQEKSSAIHSQLLKVNHAFDGTTLHIYPAQKFVKNILEKPNNNQILTSILPNISLIIHEIGEDEKPKDKTISQISAIMGGVQEVKGEMPF